MVTLLWMPQKPNDLLQVGEVGVDEPIRAGETFEASKEDAEILLQNPEIEVHEKTPTHSHSGTAATGESKGSQKNDTGDADAS